MSLAERIALLLDSPLTLLFVAAIALGGIALGAIELLQWLDRRRWKRLTDIRPYLQND